jgi:hypothetical protein
MDKLALRVLITLIITWMYCNIWMILEKIIDGQVTDRLVDNIIMLLFIPIIYLATKSIVK